MTGRLVCKRCGGSGKEYGSDFPCSRCEGSGWDIATDEIMEAIHYRHVWVHHYSGECRNSGHCSICNGDTMVCSNCRSTDKELTTDCPGAPVHPEIRKLVLAGIIDFIGKKWQTRQSKD